MGLERETNEKAQNLFTFTPVTQEGLRGTPSLDHDYPRVHAKEQQVSGSANVETVAFG